MSGHRDTDLDAAIAASLVSWVGDGDARAAAIAAAIAASHVSWVGDGDAAIAAAIAASHVSWVGDGDACAAAKAKQVADEDDAARSDAEKAAVEATCAQVAAAVAKEAEIAVSVREIDDAYMRPSAVIAEDLEVAVIAEDLEVAVIADAFRTGDLDVAAMAIIEAIKTAVRKRT
jgi:hypothetical protein